MAQMENWQQVVTRKRATRDATVQKYGRPSGASETSVKAIIDVNDIHTLVQMMHSREVTAQEVIAAYVTRYACNSMLSAC